MEGLISHSATPDDPVGQYVPMAPEEVRELIAMLYSRNPIERHRRDADESSESHAVDPEELKDRFQVHCFPGGHPEQRCHCGGSHACTRCGAECGSSTGCPDCGHDCACIGNEAEILDDRELKKLHGLAASSVGWRLKRHQGD